LLKLEIDASGNGMAEVNSVRIEAMKAIVSAKVAHGQGGIDGAFSFS
jgi:hypothetical protein